MVDLPFFCWEMLDMRHGKEEIRRSMLLYAVTDRRWLKDGETLASVCQKVLENGATFVQLREKDLPPAEIIREAEELRELCRKYRVPFVVNDSVELALESGADGVHVGQSDIQGRNIRALLGPDRILGITARTVEEAVAAQEAGADYIGVGSVFSTGTKKDARPMSRETLAAIRSAVSIPIVAIGGICADNILELTGSGVDGAAVVSGIFGADDPAAAAAELAALAKEMVGRG